MFKYTFISMQIPKRKMWKNNPFLNVFWPLKQMAARESLQVREKMHAYFLQGIGIVHELSMSKTQLIVVGTIQNLRKMSDIQVGCHCHWVSHCQKPWLGFWAQHDLLGTCWCTGLFSGLRHSRHALPPDTLSTVWSSCHTTVMQFGFMGGQNSFHRIEFWMV